MRPDHCHDALRKLSRRSERRRHGLHDQRVTTGTPEWEEPRCPSGSPHLFLPLTFSPPILRSKAVPSP
ncbi:hypothetical protein E2C01_089591 [Portunus trituberculatus]|uniref:Uncharacterized protein n=1 Tax=Portunus trituberculatus TaxID=210409 RepID=A0A5B7JJ76_PORTR|nr:hypothetical protein [Portunus trituberculatus]